MIDLLITLQSHTLSNNPGQPKQKRFASDDRSEITKRCFKSLINTIKYAIDKTENNVNIRLHIIDDHSDKETVEFLKTNIKNQTFETKFIELENTGLSNSLEFVYNYQKKVGKDLLYFAQDDYLYHEECIFEMLDSYFIFSKALNKSTFIFPFDDPYCYQPQNLVPIRIVQGAFRHWRTLTGGSCAFMFSHDVLCKEFDLFESFYKHEINHNMEIDTINKLFTLRGYTYFSPIPSLAYHLQYETERDPYNNWQKLWEKFKIEKTYNFSEPTILHVGCGKQSIQSEYPDYKEIRYDIDFKVNPDIVGNATDLSQFEDNSVDICYSHHILEHLHIDDILSTLKEMIRISRKCVKFVVPDLKIAFEKDNLLDIIYVSPAGPIHALDMIYGYTKVTKTNKYMEHKAGFTKTTLEYFLKNFNAEIVENDINLEVTIKT